MKQIYKHDEFIFLLLVLAMLLLVVVSAEKQSQNPTRELNQQTLYDAQTEHFFLLHA